MLRTFNSVEAFFGGPVSREIWCHGAEEFGSWQHRAEFVLVSLTRHLWHTGTVDLIERVRTREETKCW